METRLLEYLPESFTPSEKLYGFFFDIGTHGFSRDYSSTSMKPSIININLQPLHGIGMRLAAYP